MFEDKLKYLTKQEIIEAHKKILELYPYIPSLSLWRAYEYAVYKNLKINSPVLDVGCGDGEYFRFVWGENHEVTGIDLDKERCESAKNSGIYLNVVQINADQIQYENQFNTVFANCSLEHMDNIETILKNIFTSLTPGGYFIGSVVTDKYLDIDVYDKFVELVAGKQESQNKKQQFLDYHHLRNALPLSDWGQLFQTNGFVVEMMIPIMSGIVAELFMFIDKTWHMVTTEGQEIGEKIFQYLHSANDFSDNFNKILEAILDLGDNKEQATGLVFVCRK